MLNTSNYIAVMKWKRGERGALQDLDPKILAKITPIIEIQPIPYNHEEKAFKRTIDQHLEETGKKLSTFWDNRPIFVDGYTLYDDPRIDKNTKMSNGMTPLEFVIDEIESQGIPTIPVTTLSRPLDYNNSIQSCLAKFKNDIAIRIYLKDLSDLSKLKLELDKFINSFKISRKKVHIFLDLKEMNYEIENGFVLIDKKSIIEYTKTISNFINNFPYLNEWNTFTLLNTSVIDNFSAVPVSTNLELPRLEWQIYKGLLTTSLKRVPLYGDYTINSPTWFDFNPKKMSVAVCVKYSIENSYLIFKGVSTKSGKHDQIYNLCYSVIKHPKYCGRTYSVGDDVIYQWGTAEIQNPGNPEKWIRYWVNHHLTLVSNCLTSLPVNVVS